MSKIKECKVDWCKESISKGGYCNRHYLQMRRFGIILPIARNRNLPQEFEFHGDDCHILLYDRKGLKIATAIIDLKDYELVKDYKFSFAGRLYVRISGKSKEGFTLLHQLIMNSKWVDHKDCDRLNNRRGNLRLCTNQQNQFNSKKQSGTLSKHKGVTVMKGKSKPFKVGIQFNGKWINLGYFASEIEAAQTYNKAAKEFAGEFARLNQILIKRRN